MDLSNFISSDSSAPTSIWSDTIWDPQYDDAITTGDTSNVLGNLGNIGNLFNSFGNSNIGSNFWSSIIPALGSGIIGSLGSNQPGQYYLQRNWKGNGLANIGLGYTSNNRYQNPYGFGYALSGIANQYNPFNRGFNFKQTNNEV